MPPKECPLQKLWIFDFDGTLSPLVPDRNAAVLLPEARELLSELSKLPGQSVAVLSSRMLEDLIPRMGVEGLYLGGSSGAEWLLPSSERRTADSKTKRLEGVRIAVMPELHKLSDIQGVDVEDKRWSVAVHVRHASAGERARVLDFLSVLSRTTGIRLFKGPEVFEIQLLPEIDKLFGVITLCVMLNFVPAPGSLVYAGDDENDCTAMQWVIRKKGAALFVGKEPKISGIWEIPTPAALVSEVRKLAGLKMAP